MITRDLAVALRDAGLPWTPTEPGDLWLPREDQLRDALGEAFISLEHLPGETPGYAVSMLLGDAEVRFVDVEAESAYARAVLALLESAD